MHPSTNLAAETEQPALQGRHSCFSHAGGVCQGGMLPGAISAAVPTTAWDSRQRPSVVPAQLTCVSPSGCNTAPGAEPTTPATARLQPLAKGGFTSPVGLCRWRCCANYSISHTRTWTNAVKCSLNTQAGPAHLCASAGHSAAPVQYHNIRTCTNALQTPGKPN